MTRDIQFFFFLDGCKTHLNSEEDLLGIPNIENSEIDEHLVEIHSTVRLLLPLTRVQPSNAEQMFHHAISGSRLFLR
jgi:hypothetical protein